MTTSSTKVVAEKRVHDGPAHSELGPSAAERWLNCPGSVIATRGMTTDSVYAREGTAAHKLADMARTQKRSPWAWLGRKIKVPWESDPSKVDEFEVNGEMAEAVSEYIDYCEDFGADVSLFETRVEYTAWVPGGFGTSDDIRIRIRDKRCKITDYKHGQGKPVYAKGNVQNRLYALGIFQDLGWLYDIDIWELGIFQPRLNIVETEELSTEELLTWANTVAAPGAKLALTPGAPFKAGDWCQFCAIKQTCRTRIETRMAAVRDEFEEIVDGEPEVHTRVKSMEFMSKDELFQIYLQAGDIRKLLDDIEEYGMSELQKGHGFGDRKLVAGRSNRVYRDEAKAEAALIEELGDDAWREPTILSPAQAEKKLGKHHEFIQTHVMKPEGRPTMVGPEDKRPPLTQSRANEFEDATEDLSWLA